MFKHEKSNLKNQILKIYSLLIITVTINSTYAISNPLPKGEKYNVLKEKFKDVVVYFKEVKKVKGFLRTPPKILKYQQCTAKFIAPRALLTAAHCLDRTKHVYYSENVIQISLHSLDINLPIYATVVFHPSAGQGKPDPYDLAILILPEEDAFRGNIHALSKRKNEKVTLVGFGLNSMIFKGVPKEEDFFLNFGTNIYKIYEWESFWTNFYEFRAAMLSTWLEKENMIHIVGAFDNTNPIFPPGEHSCPCNGDSGGPLFNSNHELVGVAGANTNILDIGISYYVDLLEEKNKAFIKQVLNQL